MNEKSNGIEKFLKGKYALIIAAITGIVGAALLVSLIQNEKKQYGDLVNIIVAKNTLEPGDEFTSNNLAKKTVPRKFMLENTIELKNRNEYLGSQINIKVQKGNPILYNYLTYSAGELILSDEISIGSRAITIVVNDETGVAGYIRPNDFVDIIITYFEKDNEEGEDILVTKTLLQAVKIIKVGTPQRSTAYRSVTMNVDPKQAELLLFAKKVSISGLHLTLRNRIDEEVEELDKINWSEFMKNVSIDDD